MKRMLCFLLVAVIAIMPMAVNAEEVAYEMSISTVCDSEAIEVGDQFLVRFELTDVKPYLTFQLNGAYDCETAEIVAPVYTNKVIGVVDNTFDNETGTFNFVGYDQTLRGTEDALVCSILFKAKKAGDFTLALTERTMFGKVNENAFYVMDVNGGTFVVSEDTDGKNSAIIEDTPALTPYDDMLGYDWAEKAVGVLAKLGVLEDIADESFYPGQNVTRGDFITMLVRVCKLKSSAKAEPFGDVGEDSYQYDSVMIAKALGVALGDENGNFRPDEPITRQDICTLVYRTMRKMDKVNPEITVEDYISGFSDKDSIAPYAVESVAGLIRAKIIIGDDSGLIRPTDYMTRAEAAVVLNRLAEFNILVSR